MEWKIGNFFLKQFKFPVSCVKLWVETLKLVVSILIFPLETLPYHSFDFDTPGGAFCYKNGVFFATDCVL